MEVLNKLVKQNLIKNKQRTIVSIIGILLSCALITALFGLVVSFQETLKINSLKSYGNRHVTFKKVPFEEINDIKNHKNVESYYLTNIKSAKIEDTIIGVNGLDDKANNDLKNLLQEGRVAKDNTEIVIDVSYADDFNIKIGDTITVNTGNRYSDGYLLNDNNPLIDGETFEITNTKDYEVVGFANYYSFLSSNLVYNFYIIDNEVADLSNVHVLYKNPKDYLESTIQINEDNPNDDEPGKYNLDFNREYLRWSGYAVGDNTEKMIYGLASIISFIIIFVSVFCIRNSFTISVAEKTRTYGMLSSIGATPKQIKRTVLKEGWYLGVIGIPLGIVLGLVASYLLILITEFLINSVDAASKSFDLVYKLSFVSIIFAFILSGITIFLSSIGSARKASKITEIEAIKNQKEIKLKSKKLKTPKFIKSIFKMGGILAYKNMKRSRSKYRTTIIAIVVSITSFIAISYFIEIGLREAGNVLGEISYNVSVDVVSNEALDALEYEKLYDDISQLEYINKYSIIKSKQIRYEDGKQSHMGYIISINDEEYNRFLDKANLNYEDVLNTGIVVSNEYTSYENNENGEIIKVFDKKEQNIKYTNYKKDYTGNMDIIFSNEMFIGLENYKDEMLFIVLVSENHFEKIDLYTSYGAIYMDSNNSRELTKLIDTYEEENDFDLYTTDISEIVKTQNTMVLLVSIFLYGFISVITLIGITNIFNTITTNMMLRQREFAILKSTGMTNKEFKNMIRLESLFYGLKSLFYGLIFGIGLSYLIYLTFKQSENMMLVDSFMPSINSIILSIIFVFLIIYLIMRYSMSKINKQNIIDTIRNENI